MNFAHPRRFVAARSSATASSLLLSAALALALATTAGCKEPPPIPTTGSDVRRTLMQPDSEVKVRTLIELAEKSKETFDLPTMRQTLVEATDSAQKLSETATKLDDKVSATELLTTISEMLVKEQWERESQRAITNARIAAATIDDTSKKVAALTNLAVSLQRAGDPTIASAIINDADKIVAGITAPEQRVPQLAALHAAWIKLGDPTKQAEVNLKAATALAEKIEDPVKRTLAEVNASSASFRGDQKSTGRAFYEAALVSAEKITDPAAKASTLVDLVEILHPFRADLPIEQPLQTAIDAAAKIPDGKAKQAVTKRIDDLPKAPPRKAPPPTVP